MANLNYTSSKLYDITYRLTTHEGDARARLASVLDKLYVVQATMGDNIPQNIKADFEWAMKHVERGRTKYLRNSGLKEVTLPNIKNVTAVKIIKKILKVQDDIESLLESSKLGS